MAAKNVAKTIIRKMISLGTTSSFAQGVSNQTSVEKSLIPLFLLLLVFFQQFVCKRNVHHSLLESRLVWCKIANSSVYLQVEY